MPCRERRLLVAVYRYPALNLAILDGSDLWLLERAWIGSLAQGGEDEAIRLVRKLATGYGVETVLVTGALGRCGGSTDSLELEAAKARLTGRREATTHELVSELLDRLPQLARFVQGFFKEAYGHERLRAVIFATTTPSRAERYRGLAEALPHGRGLFWFGHYADKNEDGFEISILAPDMILDPRWVDGQGEVHSIISPDQARES